MSDLTAKDFLMSLPERVNPEALGDKETVFHFDVSGEGGGQFTAILKDGTAEVKEGFHDEAKCKITTTNKILVEVVQKKRNPQMAVFTGKLKISNLGEMMKFAKPLGLM
ncbi:MAG: SCP2 sterol-binding domain-containing protein [Saprospiraceae bacterium]|nr:SCP2 sterol-binding domain-containing protein [Saprospiraceae bacterium]